MCGCQLSLYGHISLTSSAGQLPLPGEESPSLERGQGNLTKVVDLNAHDDDWSTYQGNNKRIPATSVAIPKQVKMQWNFTSPTKAMPTAPVVAGSLVFVGDRAGCPASHR